MVVDEGRVSEHAADQVCDGRLGAKSGPRNIGLVRSRIALRGAH